MTVQNVSLDDKYTLDSGRVYITGVQALIRLPLMQRRRDQAAGLNTAGYISGYRGSPLGTYDQNLWRAKSFLKANHIHFSPGVNEDLAATAIWGSQQNVLFPGFKYDGVFGVWYGKGPGVDRCGDVFKHANAAGSSPNGGVLALAGDDHGGVSSTLAHQSELEFISAVMPVLHAANVQEYLDFGLLGWAMSRYAGVWVGFKCMTETVEASASVSVDPHRLEIAAPEFELPPGGLNVRWPDHWLEQEKRLYNFKLPAIQAFARANRFDRVAFGAAKPRLGIVATGKAYLDLRQALEDLGISEARAAELGLAVYKVGLVWPLEADGIRRFAEGVEELLVIEEKRSVIEAQLKEILYHVPADRRSRVVGKQDERGAPLLPPDGELSPNMVARVVAARIARLAAENDGGPWLRERPGDYGRLARRRLMPGAFIAAGDYVQGARRRLEMIAAVEDALREADVLLCASAMDPPSRIEDAAETERTYPRQARTPFNVTGHPALAMMAGLSQGGLPLSVQFVGRHFAEATLFRVARTWEQAAGIDKKHPPIG